MATDRILVVGGTGISYLTGSLVREQYGPKIPEHRAKLAAEHAIEASGVPYTFFRSTYFTNTMPRHVQDPRSSRSAASAVHFIRSALRTSRSRSPARSRPAQRPTATSTCTGPRS